jgi:signal transduction histidine kinase
VHDEVANIQIIGDASALTRAIVVLLDNAVKYSDRKGNVYLKTRQKGKSIYLDVIDEGIGIRASDIPHLFRRFYRADHSRGGGGRSGYGLGLSIAQRIMESHDSTIAVNSKLGQGSTFTLKLALAKSENVKPSAKS